VSNAARRTPGLDALRGLLVLAMFAVHARRLQPAFTRGPGWLDRALDALMWAEPLIAAGFLFLVGVSLVLSLESFAGLPRAAWRAKVGKRAALLYALAIALFVPQYGIELPDLIASPGILSAIALAIAATGLALGTSRPLPVLGGIATGGLLVTAALDHAEVTLSGVNAGPGGALPLVSFAAAGAAVTFVARQVGARAYGVSTLASAIPLALVVASGADWTTTRASHYLEHTGLVALPELLRAAEGARSAVPFWNHSAAGALALAFPLCLALLLFAGGAQGFFARAWLSPLRMLGRHALSAYVLHLGLLGGVELSGMAPTGSEWTWLLIALLAVAALAAARLLELRARPPEARRASLTLPAP
jgi:uncharacterized membrane protein